MLTLERYHLRLTRVVHSDIETIRRGRNLEHVRAQHLHRDEITVQEQEAWFQKINDRWSYFFMIEREKQQVGVVYVKDFTESMATSTCGVFIWDREALGSRVPILAVLTVLDLFFGELRGGSTESVVLKSNRAATKMNQFFGFEFKDGPSEELHRIRMTLERYLSQRDRLLAVARRIIKDASANDLVLSGAVSELNFPEINARLQGIPAVVTPL